MNAEEESVSLRLDAIVAASHHYLAIGNAAMAEQELRRGLAAFPEKAILHRILAIALTAQERLEEAEAEARAALGLDPGDSRSHGILGSVCMDRGEHRRAEAHLLEALRLDPMNAAFFLHYANLMFKTGHLEKAEKLVNKSLELAPEDSRAHGLLALIMAEKNKRAQAEASGRRSLSLGPDKTFPHYSTGVAYFESGRPFRARHHLREALRLQPGAAAEEAYLHVDKATRWLYLPMYYWTLAISKLPGRQFTVWFAVICCFFVLVEAGLENLAYGLLIPYALFVIYTWLAEPLVRLWIKLKPPR